MISTIAQCRNANRIKDALEAEHIIPRTRGQTPDILHGMSDEKIRRMARERMSGIEVCSFPVKL